jgi:hypothetical protein
MLNCEHVQEQRRFWHAAKEAQAAHHLPPHIFPLPKNTRKWSKLFYRKLKYFMDESSGGSFNA